jgi:hypothetical protein
MPLLTHRVTFTQGVVALREQITVVGDARWEKITEHCRAFSTTIQLLPNLGAIFHRCILIPPQRASATAAPTNTFWSDPQ